MMDEFDDIAFDDINIEGIIEEGLVEKENFFKYLKRMYKSLGIKIIFIDGMQLFVLGIVLTFVLFAMGYGISTENGASDFYGYMFLISPVIYIGMSLYGLIKAKENKTIALEMTCKYSLHQIATFRIFILSIISALINILIVGVISIIGKNISFTRPAVISVAGVFLFSSILLMILTKSKSKKIRIVFFIVWFLLSFTCTLGSEILRNIIFLKIPIWVHGIIGIIAIIVYIKSLGEFVNIRRDKGEI